MKKNKNSLLSKSTLVKGFQCPKALWLKLNKPELEGEADPGTQKRFDEGKEVGEAARKLFPKGILIDREYYEITEAIEDTNIAIKKGEKIIMEASVGTDDLYARADILKKGKKGWNLVEVKMGVSAKPEYVEDVAIQAQILTEAGIKLESVSLMHLNRECVHPDLSNLFLTQDVSDEFKEIQPRIAKKIEELRKVAKQKTEPKIAVGDQCDDPYECAFKDYCWKGIKQYKPVGTKSKAKVDVAALRIALKDWVFPLYLFDFETIGPAIPRYKGCSPYAGVPFQFSCHVLSNPDSTKFDHFEYLHQEASDPRPGIIEGMLRGLGSNGSIVSYNKGFEIGVIKKLAAFDSKSSKKLLALIPRFVDPWPVIKKTVKHPDFVEGYSLKVVAPALIGKEYNYENLGIQGGDAAQAFAEKILKGQLDKQSRKKVINDLLEYCRQDTMALVLLAKWLFDNAGLDFSKLPKFAVISMSNSRGMGRGKLK